MNNRGAIVLINRKDVKRESIATALENLASRIDYLTVSHRRPEKFFEDRSEIAANLRRLAREVCLG